MARFKPPLCGFSCAEISGKEAFAPMNDTFMKTKPVFPLLVSMALPNVISMLVNSLYNIVDSLFVAQINEQAMTALSLVFPIQNFVNAVAIGFGVGINALVALYRGAGDYDRADTAATHGMALSVLHGILCTLAATAIMPGFLARFTADGTIVSMGVTYSTIVFLFATVNMASLAFEKLFQAVGRMKLTMIALISGCVCNILLDPVLIFGLGPVPAMGIAGAALATGIGQAATLVIYLVVYSTTESPVHLRRKALRPDLSLEGRLYAIGVPAILNLALPSMLVTFLNGLLAAFSESYVVVLGIDFPLSARQRHRAGNAPPRRLQLRCKRARPRGKALPAHPRHERRHHGGRHRHLYGRFRAPHRPVLLQPRDHRHRPDRPAHHLPRLCGVGGVHHLFRRAGRSGQGCGLAGHLPLPVCHLHHAAGVAALPPARPHRRLARLLGHGSAVGCHRLCGVSEERN